MGQISHVLQRSGKDSITNAPPNSPLRPPLMAQLPNPNGCSLQMPRQAVCYIQARFSAGNRPDGEYLESTLAGAQPIFDALPE
jgi:hypothetical protein